MSRLEKHKQKLFYKKVALMIGVVILLLAFVFFIGFQFILKSSGYVGTFNKKESQTSQSEDFIGTLDIDPVVSATNSAQFIITGSSNQFDTLEYYINDKKVKISDASDTFSEKIGDLQKGKNDVYIKAISKDKKHSKSSDTFSVIYKNDKPKLEISEPNDNTKTDKSEIKIAGKTDKDVTVQINSSPVVVDAQGKFQQSLRLNEGDNKFTIIALDDAGNSEKKELTVVYHKD